MENLPKDKAQKLLTGELERVVAMSVTIGLIPRPTEKDKEEIIAGMYAILGDYASLNCTACSQIKDYECR